MGSQATSGGEQSQVDGKLAELLAELAHRMQSGEQLDLDDYVRSHPEYADKL